MKAVTDPARFVAELVAEVPAVRILVTSRVPLRIRGELAYGVEPLDVPVGDGTEALMGSPAVQLFVQSALAADRKLDIDAVMTVAAASICRALDGLPLGIELAASRARSLTAAEIADQLAEPLSIGGYALRDLPDRQQTLHATIKWSFDLLSTAAQVVLCDASIFLGGFTRPALEAVSGASVSTELDELLEANPIRRQVGSDRFELVELVRVFALRELERRGREEVARSRHGEYFRAWSKAAAEAWDVGSTTVGIPMLPDHANLRAALETAIVAGKRELAVELARGMRGIWHAGQLRQESQELVEQLLARFEIPDGADVRLMIAVGVLDYSPRGSAWYRRAAERAAEIGDTEDLARVTHEHVLARSERSRPGRARSPATAAAGSDSAWDQPQSHRLDPLPTRDRSLRGRPLQRRLRARGAEYRAGHGRRCRLHARRGGDDPTPQPIGARRRDDARSAGRGARAGAKARRAPAVG